MQKWLGSGIAVAVVRPVAIAPIRPLAWELPYAAGVALKRHTNTHTFCGCIYGIWRVPRPGIESELQL